MTREYIGDAMTLAIRAIRLALEDAGLAKAHLDGLLINAGASSADPDAPGSVGLRLQNAMGLRNLRLLTQMNGEGSTAGQMVQYAALAVTAGLADAIACVFADAPLTPGASAGAAYGGVGTLKGIAGLDASYGFFGPNTGYALHARRHMALYGTTQDQLGAVAVSTRAWAGMNPRAIMRKPLTLEEYHQSRWIIEPFHLLDVNSGATAAGQTAFRMAGITVRDVDICELYDCYTYTTLVTLEDYGFCGKGEGGAFVEGGRLGPGGGLPTNTGGGQLSGYYMWGMTPLSEGVIQARGQGEERQVAKHDVVLVTTNGGILDYHASLILTPHASLR